MIDAIDAPPMIDASPDAPLVGNWVKLIGGAMVDSVDAIAVAPDGSVYFAATFTGTIDVGGGPLTSTGSDDVLVAHFSATGAHDWSRRFGGAGSQTVRRMERAGNGDLIIAGANDGTIVFGPTTLTSSGMADVFVARLTASGDPTWAVRGGGTNADAISDLAVDGAGDVLVCGSFFGSATFFGGAQITASGADVFLSKLASASGAVAWTNRLGNSGLDQDCGIGAAANGDALLVGDYVDAFSAGGATFTSTMGASSRTRDIYAARYRGDTGAHVWSVAWPGNAQEYATDLHVDGSAVYLVGSFMGGSFTPGSTPLASTGEDGWVVKLSATDGSHLFSTRIGGADADRALRVDTRGDGGLVVGGTFRGAVNFGGTNVTSSGDADAFVADVDPASGAVLAVRTFGGLSRETLTDVDNEADAVITSGSFSGSINILGDGYTSAGLLDGFIVRVRR